MLHCKIKHLRGRAAPAGQGVLESPRIPKRRRHEIHHPHGGRPGARLACGGALAQNISIATGGTGGVYYPLGGGLGEHAVEGHPGHERDGGSDRRLGRQHAAHRHRQAVHRVHAWPTRRSTRCKGEDKFKGKPVPARTLWSLYPNRMHVVTIEGTGVNKIEDLKGKRVSTGSPGSATEVLLSA